MTIKIPEIYNLMNRIKGSPYLKDETKKLAINELKRINLEFKHTNNQGYIFEHIDNYVNINDNLAFMFEWRRSRLGAEFWMTINNMISR